MALDMASVWGCITAMMFVTGFCLLPSGEVLGKMLTALPMLCAGQVLNFGLTVWVLRYRSGWLVIVPIFLSLFASLFVLGVGGWIMKDGAAWQAAAFATVLALLGAGITFDAYRRWLVTEFD